MNCSTPGSSVLHCLLEFAQIQVHWVGDTIHLILCCSLLLLPSILPRIRVFSNEWLFTSSDQSIGASASASVLLMNIQGWFPLGLTGLISVQSKGLATVFSSATAFESINSLALSLVYGPTLTSIHTTGKTTALTRRRLKSLVYPLTKQNSQLLSCAFFQSTHFLPYMWNQPFLQSGSFQ